MLKSPFQWRNLGGVAGVFAVNIHPVMLIRMDTGLAGSRFPLQDMVVILRIVCVL